MTRHRLALNSELTLIDGHAPEWVELIPTADPATGRITGRDGRTWVWDAAAHTSVLEAFRTHRIDAVIDWEHATQHRAGKGQEAPASGWIKEVEMRDGALWGRVEWTPRAADQIVKREYRFLSPVFDFLPSTLRVFRFVTAGLTNTPNLPLQALNQEESEMSRSSTLVAAITGVLGLTAEAADDAVAEAINKLKTAHDTALNSQQREPSLDRYVPRADYEALNQRALNAEQRLQERDTAAHKAAVDEAITGALQAGKITPATEEYHRAMCSDTAGLERFKAFVGTAPTVAADSDLDKRQPEDKATALNSVQKEAARLLGMSETEYKTALAASKE